MTPELVILLALSAGCGGTPMSQQLQANRGRGYAQTIDTLGVEGAIQASAAKVWTILPTVFVDLGLDINFREPTAKRLGTCYQRIRTRLGKELLSTYLDCGEIQSFPNADRYDVELTVLTTVRPQSEAAANVYTFVLGVALDGSGVASNRVWCQSKGQVEERIRRMAEERARS